MPRTLYFPQDFTPTPSGSSHRSTTLPPVIGPATTPPPGWLNHRAKGHNAHICIGEAPYYQPFVRGDLFAFQLQLRDVLNDPHTAPSAGWRTVSMQDIAMQASAVHVEVRDLNEQVVLSNVSALGGRYYVASFGDAGTRQYFELDTTRLPSGLERFYLHVIALDADQRPIQQFVSEPYAQVAQDNTLWIQSQWSTTDDLARIYDTHTLIGAIGNTDTPPPPFAERLRVHGALWLAAGSAEREETDTLTRIQTDIVRTYEWEAFSAEALGLPDYMAERLISCLSANEVHINGVQYRNFTEIQRNSDDTGGQSWFISGTAQRIERVRAFRC